MTFPLLILSLLTGPKVASLADMATLRLPVLHRGPGGVLVTSFEVYRPPRAAGGGASALGFVGVDPLMEHIAKTPVKKLIMGRNEVRNQ